MALTRANVEYIRGSRLRDLRAALDMSEATSGGNDDLNDPIGYAIRQLGGSVASVWAVSDSDVAGIAGSDYDELFDLAELRALETMRSKARRLTDITAGPRSDQFSAIAAGLAADIADKRADIKARYGTGAATLEAGVLTLDFMQQAESGE